MSLFSVWPKVVTSSGDWIEYFLTKCEFSAEQWLCLIIYYKDSNNCCIFIGSLIHSIHLNLNLNLDFYHAIINKLLKICCGVRVTI